MDLFRCSMAPEAGEAAKRILTPDENGRVYCGQGKWTDEFELEFARRTGLHDADRPLGVNSATAAIDLALHLAGVGPGDEVITTAMTCLWAKSRVQISDGSTRPISLIVNRRETPEVLSLNSATGRIESKRVTNWIKLPAKGVEWFRLSTERAKGTRGTLGTRGVRLTGDHKVYTERGWVRADALVDQDRIATRHTSLNTRQLEFLDGTLLGDGYLTSPHRGSKGYSRFAVIHSTRQRELVQLKQRALDGLPIRYWEKPAYKGTGPTCGVESIKTPQLSELRERWYSSHGRKIVPADLTLSPMKLAVWYMDDGSYSEGGNVVFCTDGFDTNSVWTLFWKLNEIGFHPRVHLVHGERQRILIQRNEQDRFFAMVAPYVPNSLRYKLPEDSPAFDHTLWDLGSTEPWFDRVYITRATPNQDTRFVYCLEVEDNHNFIVSDMVVANCTATNGPVVNRGASIVWADIDPTTGLIDPVSVGSLVTMHTKAVIAVDWAGRHCDYPRLRDALNVHSDRSWKFPQDIPIIEDAAHCLYLPKVHGDYVAYSFGPIKHLSMGGYGGALIVPERQYKRAELLRWHGLDRHTNADFRCGEQDIAEAGYRYHLTDDLAVVGLANLPMAQDNVRIARAHAKYYANALADVPGIVVPPYDPTCNYWLHGLIIEEDRDGFGERMAAQGIPTSRTHARNDYHAAYMRAAIRQDSELSGTAYFDSHQINIPGGAWLSWAECEQVADAAKAAVSRVAA